LNFYLAMSNAMRLFAYSDAFRAVKHFTSFIRAFDLFFKKFNYSFILLKKIYSVLCFFRKKIIRSSLSIKIFNYLIYFAFRFFAFNIANSVFRFSTWSMAFGRFADWIANCWTMRIVAFPWALGMALLLICY